MKKYKWLYQQDGVDAAAILALPGAVLVKENAKRTVHKAGNAWYIKREHAFRNKAALELKIALRLQKENIPCVRFAAYGKCGFMDTVLISRAERNTVSALEYFYTRPERRTAFLSALGKLMKSLKEKKIRHDDFHAGNVLVRDEGDGCALILVDPVAVKFNCSVPPLLLASFAGDLLPELTEDELADICSAVSDQPQILARQVHRALEKKISAQWKKRSAQILSGSSKFIRTLETQGRVFRIPATPWYAPGVLPQDFSFCTQRLMEREEADQCLLAFFRLRLEGKRAGEAEIAFLEDLPDGKTVLYTKSAL